MYYITYKIAYFYLEFFYCPHPSTPILSPYYLVAWQESEPC